MVSGKGWPHHVEENSGGTPAGADRGLSCNGRYSREAGLSSCNDNCARGVSVSSECLLLRAVRTFPHRAREKAGTPMRLRRGQAKERQTDRNQILGQRDQDVSDLKPAHQTLSSCVTSKCSENGPDRTHARAEA